MNVLHLDSGQSFAHCTRITLPDASSNIVRMKYAQPSLADTAARNVQVLFERSGMSRRELARKAGVAPNSIRHMLEPESRPMASRKDTAPRLDILEKIAMALNVSVWQLLTKDFDPANPPSRILSKSEAEFYERIQQAYSSLANNTPDD